MKLFVLLILGFSSAVSLVSWANPQKIAGVQPIALTITEKAVVAEGLSAKKSILGKIVYNEKGEEIGEIEDLIVATDAQVSFAIVAAGGFLDVGKHKVAVPVRLITLSEKGSLTVVGGSKEALKSFPQFRYK